MVERLAEQPTASLVGKPTASVGERLPVSLVGEPAAGLGGDATTSVAGKPPEGVVGKPAEGLVGKPAVSVGGKPTAGLEANPAEGGWVQLGIAAGEGPLPYAELAGVVHEWVADGVLSDFFFMHKPPGLRVRFAAGPGQLGWVRGQLRELADRWRRTGLIAGVQPGVYEPEEQLFGGPASMRHVHRLFTVDALTWLDYHATRPAAPAWALSLAMVRTVFAGLHIAGWEEYDAWGRVARAGRELPPGAAVDTGVAALALRRWWERPNELVAALPPPARHLADRHASRIAPLLRDWRREYFDSSAAVLGPRQACAYYTIFHWNRAALSYGRQVLIASALSAVGHVD